MRATPKSVPDQRRRGRYRWARWLLATCTAVVSPACGSAEPLDGVLTDDSGSTEDAGTTDSDNTTDSDGSPLTDGSRRGPDATNTSDGKIVRGDASDSGPPNASLDVATTDARIADTGPPFVDAATPDVHVNDAGGGLPDSAAPRDAAPPPVSSRFFPAPDAQGLCVDPSLRIQFTSAPTLGTTGTVRVFDAARPGTPVATINMAATTFTESIDGKTYNTTRPVFVDGNEAVFHFAARTLTYGTTYFATVDRGVVTSREEPSFGVTGNSAWRFTTAVTAPALAGEVGVATDGSRPFCSLQGALDAVAKVTTPVVVTLSRGTYHEIVHATGRRGLTVRGADRKATKVSWINNNTLNAGTSARGLFTIEQSTSVTLENLTIENLTPQGGSQAEALRFGACDQCIVRSADVHSLQDTLMLEGRVFLTDCFITGNVDFVWGRGVVYFSKCEIKTVGRSGPIVQSRNEVDAYGYVFVDSTLSSDSGLTGSVLARVDASVYPGSQVAFVGCKIGPHITPAGWTITGGTPPATLRFWEFGSMDLAGNALDTSKRLAGSTRITSAQAATLRDPKIVLNGWAPQ